MSRPSSAAPAKDGKQWINQQRQPWSLSAPRSSPTHDQAASYHGLCVANVELLAALGANDARGRTVSARLVQEFDRWGRQIGPFVAPLHERRIDGEQGSALVRQPVLVQFAACVLSVWPAHKGAVVDEQIELVGEDVACESDASLEVLEASRAVERLAKDYPHPALTNNPR